MESTTTLEVWPGQPTETLTVGGLIKLLSRHDKTLPVVAEWEGGWHPVQKSTILVSTGRVNNSDITVLLLGVDEQF